MMEWHWPSWYGLRHILITELVVERMTLTQIAATKEDRCKPIVMAYKMYRLLKDEALGVDTDQLVDFVERPTKKKGKR